MTYIKLVLSFFLFLIMIDPLFAVIEKDEYLKQVLNKNGDFLGTKLSIKAKEERKYESKALFHPNFYANAQLIDDQKPVSSTTFLGNKTDRTALTMGVSDLFPTGTKLNLSYNFLHTEVTGASPVFVPQKSYYDLSPQIEISQSLWRNFFGRESRSVVNLGIEQNIMNQNIDKFKFKQLLLNAEMTYWKLVYAQIVLKIQTDLYDGAKKLRDWSSERVKKGLAESTDFFQADASFKMHEIEMQNAKIEYQVARKNFQSLRGRDDDEDIINLGIEPLKLVDKLLSYKLPQRMKLREDLLAAMSAQKIAFYSAVLGQEKNRPNVELFGSYATNGRAVDASGAMEDTLKTNHPYSVIGARLNIDLDVFATNTNLKSYQKDKTAADLIYQRKIEEVENDWDNLVKRFLDLQEKMKMGTKLSEIQKQKFEMSKSLFNKGKMTTFQMLQFEADYGNSQLQNVRYQLDFLATFNQIKLFCEESYE